MDSKKFVSAIDLVVSKAAKEDVTSILESPPGRKPEEDLVKMSDFYKALNPEEKLLVENIISLSVEESVFGFLCVLDGVRAIGDGPDKGELVLTYKAGTSTQINNEMDLHDIFNARQFE